MNISLSQEFPPRTLNFQPNSGFFYKRPKIKLSKNGVLKQKLPSTTMILDKKERDFHAEISSLANAPSQSRRSNRYLEKLEKIHELSSDRVEAHGLPLLQSFSSHSCFLGRDNRKTAAVQAEDNMINKIEFADLRAYRIWGTDTVDPFVRVRINPRCVELHQLSCVDLLFHFSFLRT